MTPITNAPDQRVADVAAPAQEARATDDHGGDRVELGELSERRRAAIEPAGGDHPGDAGRQAAQRVDRDRHGVDRDARPPGALGVAADRVDPAAPDDPGAQDGEQGGDAEDDEGRQREPADRATTDGVDDRRHVLDRLSAREVEGQTTGDAERGEGDDERVGQMTLDVDDAVDEPDGEAGRKDRQHDDRPRRDRLEDERPDDSRERQDGADRQVDPAGQDDEELAHREQGDHRGLRQHVARVPRGQEDRRQQAERGDEQEEHQDRARGG